MMTTTKTPPEGMSRPLRMFVLYHSPADYPGLWVMRRWDVSNELQATDEVWISASSPEPLRERCRGRGMFRMPRQEGDDPVIVETWL